MPTISVSYETKAAWKALDDRWNSILTEDDFISLDKL